MPTISHSVRSPAPEQSPAFAPRRQAYCARDDHRDGHHFGVLLALLACVACSAPQEWVREYDGQLPDTDQQDSAVFLVRDAISGAPIEGAVIRRHLWGLVGANGKWAPVRGKCHTDSLGLARLRPPAHGWGNLWTIEAKGYATTEAYDLYPQTVVEMDGGSDVRTRLIGPFGNPIPDVAIESVLSVAGPALARSQTDGDGIVRFQAVDTPDGGLYFRGSSIPPAAATGLFTYGGGSRFPIRDTCTDPGVTFRGRILLADGTPARGAVVRNGSESRGAWTVVADDGSFRLNGADPDCGLEIQWNENWIHTKKRYRHAEPIVIRIGAETSVPLHEVTADAGVATGTVTFERESDGQLWTAAVKVPALLPAGRYRAVLGDPVSEFVGRSELFEVPGTDRIEIEAERQPRLGISWSEPELSKGPANLHFEEGTWPLDSEGRRFIDAEAKAVLVLERDGARRFFPVGDLRDGNRRVAVRMPTLRRLAVTDVEKASYVTFYGPIWCPSEELRISGDTIATRARGPVSVLLEFNDREQRELRFDIGEDGANPLEPIHVERSALPPSRRLRIEPPPGFSADDVTVRVVAAEIPFLWKNAISTPDLDPAATEIGDPVESPWFRDGSIVRLSIDDSGLFPLRATLRGEGPYRVRWPTCSLRIRGAVDSVYIDGVLSDEGWARYPDDDDELVVFGLSAGVHDLIARAPGGKWYWHRVVLGKRESRTILVGKEQP